MDDPYGSVFIVLNEDGDVVAWQFTKTTSLEEVKPLLLKLKKRIQNESLVINTDNCCQVRQQIQDIFGQGVVVKLDLFHAVQRVEASSRHSFMHAASDCDGTEGSALPCFSFFLCSSDLGSDTHTNRLGSLLQGGIW